MQRANKNSNRGKCVKSLKEKHCANGTIKPNGLNKYELRKVAKSAAQKNQINTPAKTK